jgi:hypothetical protein
VKGSIWKPIPGDNAQYEKILPVFQKIAENQCVVAELMAEMK